MTVVFQPQQTKSREMPPKPRRRRRAHKHMVVGILSSDPPVPPLRDYLQRSRLRFSGAGWVSKTMQVEPVIRLILTS